MEDCAEAFFGFDYLGHPQTDVALFSFGAIKNCTCFGGGIVKVKNEHVLREMRRIQNDYSCVSNFEYFLKVFKYRFLSLGLNLPSVTRLGVPLFNAFGVDYRKHVVSKLKTVFHIQA